MSARTTLIGNAVGDVELRYTQTGKAVGSLTVAVSDRRKNAQGEWEDGGTWFARCTIWGELAEHAASSIHKGIRVIAEGRIQEREWQDKDGNKRRSVEVIVDEVGPSLRYATAQVTRTSSRGGQSGGWPQQQQSGWAPEGGAQPGGWNSPPSTGQDQYESEPPF